MGGWEALGQSGMWNFLPHPLSWRSCKFTRVVSSVSQIYLTISFKGISNIPQISLCEMQPPCLYKEARVKVGSRTASCLSLVGKSVRVWALRLRLEDCEEGCTCWNYWVEFPGWIWGLMSNHLHIFLALPGRDFLEVTLLSSTWKNLLSYSPSLWLVSVSHGSLLITVS